MPKNHFMYTRLIALLMFIVLKTTAQDKALIHLDVENGKAYVTATINVPQPIPASLEFTLLNSSDLHIHRRQIRKREPVKFSVSGNTIKVDVSTFTKEPHQAIELEYTIDLHMLGGKSLFIPNERLIFNPLICKECSDANPFDAKRFSWNKVLPSIFTEGELGVRMIKKGEFRSSQQPNYTVSADNEHLLVYSGVQLQSFYFSWIDLSVILASTIPPDDKRVQKQTTSKERTVEKKTQDSLLAEVKAIQPEKFIRDSLLAADTEKTTDTTHADEPQRLVAFEIPFDTLPFVFFNRITEDEYNFIHRDEPGTTTREREYIQFKMSYGEAEADIRLRHLIDYGGYIEKGLSTQLISKLLDMPFDTTTAHYRVQHHRDKDQLEVSLKGKPTQEVIIKLVFDDNRDTTINLKGGDIIVLRGEKAPVYFFPYTTTTAFPLRGSMTDGQALTLYNKEDGALARYRALMHLFTSTSPHLRATSASFSMDDELECIRNLALETSAGVPAYAAARLESDWRTFAEEGNSKQSRLAQRLLSEKLNIKVDIPTTPCASNNDEPFDFSNEENRKTTFCQLQTMHQTNPKKAKQILSNALQNENHPNVIKDIEVFTSLLTTIY